MITALLLFQRITNITTTLQYSLEGSFLEGLEQEDVGMLRQCLRTYALIDKIRDAELLFRQHVVKPYMEEVRDRLVDQSVLTHVHLFSLLGLEREREGGGGGERERGGGEW